MKIRNVLLDWSGTLADDLPPVVEATNQVLAHYGKEPLSRDAFCRAFRLPFSEFYAEVLPGVPMAELDPLYTQFFDASDTPVAELPGARQFLEHCADTGRRVFLLSSIKTHHFERQAQALGFRDYFEHPYTEVWDKRLRIGEILATHQLDRATTLFAGDMRHDIDTAKHGGVTAVATLTGYDSREELQASEPDWMVDDLSSLIGRL